MEILLELRQIRGIAFLGDVHRQVAGVAELHLIALAGEHLPPDRQQILIGLVEGHGHEAVDQILVVGDLLEKPRKEDLALGQVLAEAAAHLHFRPLHEDLGQRRIDAQQLLREGDDRLLVLRQLRPQGLLDERHVVQRVHPPLVVNAEAPRAAGDLLDLPRVERPALVAVELVRLQEDDPPHGHIEAHADGVRRHHDIRLSLAELPRLLIAHVIGQRAVNDTAGLSQLLQLGRRRVHISSGKYDQRVPGAHVLREFEDLVLEYERRLPLVIRDLEGVPALLDHPFQEGLRRRRRADVDLPGAHAHDRRGPGPSALVVRHHLGLVDDRHLITALEVEHLDRRRPEIRPLHLAPLLAGHQRTGRAGAVEIVVLLVGQQAERGQIDAALRIFQGFDGLVGLAGIRWTDVQDKMPLHRPGQRIEVRIVPRDRVGNALGDQVQPLFSEHALPDRHDVVRILLQKLRHPVEIVVFPEKSVLVRLLRHLLRCLLQQKGRVFSGVLAGHQFAEKRILRAQLHHQRRGGPDPGPLQGIEEPQVEVPAVELLTEQVPVLRGELLGLLPGAVRRAALHDRGQHAPGTDVGVGHLRLLAPDLVPVLFVVFGNGKLVNIILRDLPQLLRVIFADPSPLVVLQLLQMLLKIRPVAGIGADAAVEDLLVIAAPLQGLLVTALVFLRLRIVLDRALFRGVPVAVAALFRIIPGVPLAALLQFQHIIDLRRRLVDLSDGQGVRFPRDGAELFLPFSAAAHRSPVTFRNSSS